MLQPANISRPLPPNKNAQCQSREVYQDPLWAQRSGALGPQRLLLRGVRKEQRDQSPVCRYCHWHRGPNNRHLRRGNGSPVKASLMDFLTELTLSTMAGSSMDLLCRRRWVTLPCSASLGSSIAVIMWRPEVRRAAHPLVNPLPRLVRSFGTEVRELSALFLSLEEAAV